MARFRLYVHKASHFWKVNMFDNWFPQSDRCLASGNSAISNKQKNKKKLVRRSNLQVLLVEALGLWFWWTFQNIIHGIKAWRYNQTWSNPENCSIWNSWTMTKSFVPSETQERTPLGPLHVETCCCLLPRVNYWPGKYILCKPEILLQ